MAGREAERRRVSRKHSALRLSFNCRLRVDFQGSCVTSDSGLLLMRELDERLGFGELIKRPLTGLQRRLVKTGRSPD